MRTSLSAAYAESVPAAGSAAKQRDQAAIYQRNDELERLIGLTETDREEFLHGRPVLRMAFGSYMQARSAHMAEASRPNPTYDRLLAKSPEDLAAIVSASPELGIKLEAYRQARSEAAKK